MDNKYFHLNGLLGFLISIIVLLLIVVLFGFKAVNIQKREATNYYRIDSTNVKMIDAKNRNNYHTVGEKR